MDMEGQDWGKSGKAILAQDLVDYMCTQMECRPFELAGRSAVDSPVYNYKMLNKKTKEVVAEFELFFDYFDY